MSRVFMTAKGERLGHSIVTSGSVCDFGRDSWPLEERMEGGARDAGDVQVFVPSSPGQAEVQAVFSDGAVSLHTRSLKYGKVSWALALLIC